MKTTFHAVKPLKPYVTKTGCLVLPSKTFHDERGSFIENFKNSNFFEIIREAYHVPPVAPIDFSFPTFIQDNISFSKKNVVRGLHFQTDGHEQGKLVSVVNGEALDVVVDLRKGSATYGMVETFQLLPMQLAVYIPPGFAHGFWAKEENTIFIYKCTSEYYPSGEGGINPLDEQLCLPWMDFKDDLIIAPKDRAFPTLEELKN